MRLLLIQDNPAMQATLKRSFERRGMQVSTCGDGFHDVFREQARYFFELDGRRSARIPAVVRR